MKSQRIIANVYILSQCTGYYLYTGDAWVCYILYQLAPISTFIWHWPVRRLYFLAPIGFGVYTKIMQKLCSAYIGHRLQSPLIHIWCVALGKRGNARSQRVEAEMTSSCDGVTRCVSVTKITHVCRTNTCFPPKCNGNLYKWLERQILWTSFNVSDKTPKIISCDRFSGLLRWILIQLSLYCLVNERAWLVVNIEGGCHSAF